MELDSKTNNTTLLVMGGGGGGAGGVGAAGIESESDLDVPLTQLATSGNVAATPHSHPQPSPPKRASTRVLRQSRYTLTKPHM